MLAVIGEIELTSISFNYKTNNLGYIGRHVPRKRPELAIETIKEMKLNDIKVFNMGVDFNKGGNEYWKKLQEKYPLFFDT